MSDPNFCEHESPEDVVQKWDDTIDYWECVIVVEDEQPQTELEKSHEDHVFCRRIK